MIVVFSVVPTSQLCIQLYELKREILTVMTKVKIYNLKMYYKLHTKTFNVIIIEPPARL